MPTTSNNDQVFINRTSSGFPDYLDFNTLRTDAINYLGPITSSYWTDYNIHDPGITTLEALLYAIMDLGYRVNFPIEDLLARSPGESTPENNFLTPGQALGCNPFTITDYRKKLMDIAEVRNAWLEINKVEPASSTGNPSIMGIYDVYLELEMEPAQFDTALEWTGYKDRVLKKVKKKLGAHRNLCEDFAEPRILSKDPVVISADIEIGEGASLPAVYQDLVRTLYAYFSPVPHFYNLGQLTAMKIPMDQVFEGRPYDQFPSHGFILNSELPDRPSAETPIYLSAVYNQILQVEDIKTVRNLTLQAGKDKEAGIAQGKEWVFHFPEGTIPVYSITDSDFRWYRNGKLLTADLRSYNKALRRDVVHAGKVIYQAGSDDLDGIIPPGTVLQGLGNYISIQNDYPQVYGIGPGGLPVTASAQRKAQALQFKGFLLFFDQLLANYLAQLSNIRQLFSISSGAGDDEGNGSTYFAGDLSSVPGLNDLLRFPPGGAGVGGTSTPGSTLAFPVHADEWDKIILSGSVTCTQLESLTPYTFSSVTGRDIAVEELALSFSVLSPVPQYIIVGDNEVLYYIAGAREGLVLVSKSRFADQVSASKEVATVLFIGAATENYSLFFSGASDPGVPGSPGGGAPLYSFSLVQTGASYYNYLQTLLEDPAQNTQRRTGFLLHLMDRFAESFTDYAFLSAGFLQQQEIDAGQPGLMENFLGGLPVLSAGRGMAFDYGKPGWNNGNTSGFEKRFNAYCGITDWRRHYLCNFEVDKEEKKYKVKMTIAGYELLACSDPFLQKDTIPAAADLYKKMKDRGNYRMVHGKVQGRWVIGVSFYDGNQALSVMDWPDEEGAAAVADQLVRMWRLAPHEEDIRVSQLEYRPELVNAEDHVVRTAVSGSKDEETAWADATKKVHHIHDPKNWLFDPGSDRDIGKLEKNRDPAHQGQYMDIKGFNILIQHDNPQKPEHFRFTVSDDRKVFLFSSTHHFPTSAEARAASQELLYDLTDAEKYMVSRDQATGRCRITIRTGDRHLADEEKEFDDEEEAGAMVQTIMNILLQRLYTLRIRPIPISWDFYFYLGLPGGHDFLFRSSRSYVSSEAAREAAVDFYKGDTGWELKKDNGELILVKAGISKDHPACTLEKTDAQQAMPEDELESEIKKLTLAKSTIHALDMGDKDALGRLVSPDEESKQGGYVYRLLDKDHPRAYHSTDLSAAGNGREEAERVREKLISKGSGGYLFPEICLGGDNVQFEEGKGSGAGKYYFRIRCRNDYYFRIGLPGRDEEWTFFESVTGYESENAAQQAFLKNYLLVLDKAMQEANYGDGAFISLKDRMPVSGDDGESVVFVPAEIREAFARAGLDPVRELVKAAMAYPIRELQRDSLPARYIPRDRYLFVLVNEETGETDWESAGDFADPQQAHAAFDYFRLLLNVPGNYFIEYDETDCHFRIGIREVLAESANAFPDEEKAWGPEGVEKFICVAQSAGGSHPEKRKDGNWGWFVACRNDTATHPCQYGSEQERDRALDKLYEAALHFPLKGWMSGEEEITIHDGGTGHALGRFTPAVKDVSGEEVLNIILDIEDAVWAGNNFREDADGLYLQAGKDAIRVRPAVPAIRMEEWEKELLRFAAYFPIVRNSLLQGGATISEYLLEMKLPGFAEMPGPWPTDKDCGCPPPVEPGKEPACYAAWVSCKTSLRAADAWEAYRQLVPLLAEKKNYRPVHGEGPGSYGIELYEQRQIIATSPQTYYYPEMAGRALVLARACINTEGVDLAEHILLRPGTGQGKGIPSCLVKAEDSTLPFQPGEDPYSFIMTAVLPAWPERFRKKDNRQRLESILQREAPSHILLRILWLTPRDMCRFESCYKDWLRWLVPEKPCGDFHPDSFVEILFNTSFACLDDCAACGEGAVYQDNSEWLSQINGLYCWNDRICADTLGWKWEGAGAPGQAGTVAGEGTDAGTGTAAGNEASAGKEALAGKDVAGKAGTIGKASTMEKADVGKQQAIGDRVGAGSGPLDVYASLTGESYKGSQTFVPDPPKIKPPEKTDVLFELIRRGYAVFGKWRKSFQRSINNSGIGARISRLIELLKKRNK